MEAPLIIAVTKSRGKPAQMLAGLGFVIVPIAEDDDAFFCQAEVGNVDRYVLSPRLVVERRTGSSFLAGIQDKTLFTSAIYLREHFDIPILIVEGQVNYDYSLFSPQAVRGALTSMMLEYGINVLSTRDIEDTVALIAMLARQEQVGIPEISLIPKRQAADLPDVQRRVIEMLPGCGRVMARDLLQHFGSIRRIVSATEAELRTVRGIGGKKAAEIVRVFNADYEAVDTEKNLEDAIKADPSLLFARPVKLLARQHYIFSEGDERHIVDLVFVDEAARDLILVELKRGALVRAHEAQLRRYLEHARESPLLRGYIDAGFALRGLLATIEAGDFVPKSNAIGVSIVDKDRVIQVLKALRQSGFGVGE